MSSAVELFDQVLGLIGLIGLLPFYPLCCWPDVGHSVRRLRVEALEAAEGLLVVSPLA